MSDHFDGLVNACIMLKSCLDTFAEDGDCDAIVVLPADVYERLAFAVRAKGIVPDDRVPEPMQIAGLQIVPVRFDGVMP